MKNEMQRVCLALDLKNAPEIIKEYIRAHNEDYWHEIREGIISSGFQVMDIYNVDNRLFMICEIPADLDFDAAWNSISDNPRQDEWGEWMSKLQAALPGHELKWVKMKQIYHL